MTRALCMNISEYPLPPAPRGSLLVCKVNLFSVFFSILLYFSILNIFNNILFLLHKVPEIQVDKIYGPKLLRAEIVMGRFCYGPK